MSTWIFTPLSDFFMLPKSLLNKLFPTTSASSFTHNTDSIFSSSYLTHSYEEMIIFNDQQSTHEAHLWLKVNRKMSLNGSAFRFSFGVTSIRVGQRVHYFRSFRFPACCFRTRESDQVDGLNLSKGSTLWSRWWSLQWQKPWLPRFLKGLQSL